MRARDQVTSAVSGVVKPRVADAVGRSALTSGASIGLRYCGHHQLRIRPCSTQSLRIPRRETRISDPTSCENQAPRVAAICRAQNPRSVVGVKRIIGVAGARQDHACASGLDGKSADADGRVARASNRGRASVSGVNAPGPRSKWLRSATPRRRRPSFRRRRCCRLGPRDRLRWRKCGL